jgi:hypothetical protein
MNVKLLTTPWQRALGAMFHRSLGDTVFLFSYPHRTPRTFHTCFCPPLRIIALDEEGQALFDRVTPPGQFVKLPPSRLVVEADPGYSLTEEKLRDLTQGAPETRAASGAWEVTTSIDRLLFALLKEAVADIRRVHEAHNRCKEVRQEVLREKFTLCERGQLANSAGFLLDFSHLCNLPETALQLSWQVLDVEANCLAEITAASVAGVPWQGDFPIQCLRCGRTEASWRPVLDPSRALTPESTWRYERPENHVPLCRRCAAWLEWGERGDLKTDLAQVLWGQRFNALWAWHQAARQDRLPADWDLEDYPLWPREYGGENWESGSGAFEHVDPRPPEGVCRTTAHRAALSRILNGRGGIKAKRGRGQFIPWHPLVQLVDVSSV